MASTSTVSRSQLNAVYRRVILSLDAIDYRGTHGIQFSLSDAERWCCSIILNPAVQGLSTFGLDNEAPIVFEVIGQIAGSNEEDFPDDDGLSVRLEARQDFVSRLQWARIAAALGTLSEITDGRPLNLSRVLSINARTSAVQLRIQWDTPSEIINGMLPAFDGFGQLFIFTSRTDLPFGQAVRALFTLEYSLVRRQRYMIASLMMLTPV
ncbi:hypothetical protein B0H21DRAFT_698277 [Amylocystis lapponica]|nr:hypothetical protein B0H21DRAFT_698277 [Amylocystis lapponica]